MRFRYGMPLLLAVALLLAFAGWGAAGELRDGDIIFQTNRDPRSLAIRRATGSRYSHVGIVIHRSGFPQVFEAAARVCYTPLSQWIGRGVGGHYVVKRLRNADSILNGEMLSKLRRTAEEFRGRPYDPLYLWSDDRLYCSELVWKIFHRALGLKIGKPVRMKELELSSPQVRKELKRTYGRNIPLEEKVVTPAILFNSPLLVTVEEE